MTQWLLPNLSPSRPPAHAPVRDGSSGVGYE